MSQTLDKEEQSLSSIPLEDQDQLPGIENIIHTGDEPFVIFGNSLCISRDMFNILHMGFGFFCIVCSFIATQVNKYLCLQFNI